ncbi:MAG: DUF3604 domain-containing protein, partial [Nitrososphaeria archaeon]|nr:DUF3604 domain-containing protein [Nitrososphaeria archaeon]
DGLSRGYKFGIIASGDNHRDYPGVWGNGVMAVFARELTRESLWEAFKKRRVYYGVTGDRIKLFFSINGHIMGESFNSKDPANIIVEAIGAHAIDRIEIIRNGRVVHTYSHSGKWSIPHRDEAVQAKLRIQCGWGTGTGLYGFKKVESKTWNGSIEISDGEIVSVEPCFTHFGQELRKVANNRWAFTFTTQPRSPLGSQLAQHHRGNIQGAIFEVNATPKSRIKIQVDSVDIDISLEEALRKARLIPLMEEVKQAVYEQFGLTPDEVDNPDVFWHNAWKMKISKAIPRAGYHAKL